MNTNENNLRTNAMKLADALNAVAVRTLGWIEAGRKDWRSSGWRDDVKECHYHRNEILAANDDGELKRACRAAARFLCPSCFPRHVDLIPAFCRGVTYWKTFA